MSILIDVMKMVVEYINQYLAGADEETRLAKTCRSDLEKAIHLDFAAAYLRHVETLEKRSFVVSLTD